MVLFPSHNQKFLIIVTRYKAAIFLCSNKRSATMCGGGLGEREAHRDRFHACKSPSIRVSGRGGGLTGRLLGAAGCL